MQSRSQKREDGDARIFPISLNNMQNILFLALLRPIFALNTKIAPLNGIGDESWSRTWCDIDQEKWVLAWMKTSFFLGRSLKIWTEKLSQFQSNRLVLFPAFKTALQCKLLATRPISVCWFSLESSFESVLVSIDLYV